MDFLFLFAQKTAPLVPAWLVLWFFLRKIKDDTVRKGLYQGAWIGTFLMLVISAYTTFNVAGPRNEVRKAHVPSGPTHTVEIKDVGDFVEKVDRLGQFDEKIKAEAPPKQ